MESKVRVEKTNLPVAKALGYNPQIISDFHCSLYFTIFMCYINYSYTRMDVSDNAFINDEKFLNIK